MIAQRSAVLAALLALLPGCSAPRHGGVTATLVCDVDLNTPSDFETRGVSIVIHNGTTKSIELESEQLTAVISGEVHDCAGMRIPNRLPPMPLPANKRHYLVLGPGESCGGIFRLYDVTRADRDCYVIRYHYRPSAYPEALEHGAFQDEIISNALLLKADGTCEDFPVNALLRAD